MLKRSVGVFALKSMIPAPLRYRLNRFVVDAAVLPQILHSAFSASPSGGPPRIFYGVPNLPASDQPVHGGLVKVQRMQAAWPNTTKGFNTLYMVSSAMPPAARWWAALARRRGARVVWNQNGVSTPAWEHQGWRATNAAMRPLLRAADHVFYQSEFCKISADRFLGQPTGSWEILHNAVDTRVFVPRAEPLPESPLLLMLGGNQSEGYRVAAAVAALGVLVRRGTDARLLVTGNLRWHGDSNRAMKEARDLIDREGVSGRVDFVGPYSQAQAPSLLQRAHILLHTKYNDPSPGIVIEALASGLPVVYSASGGVPELVGEDAGVGIPVESSFDRMIAPAPDALADGVERVRASFEDYSTSARRRAVERFDMAPWLARHAEIFERGRA